MGHIQQLAFALGPDEPRPTAPVRSRPGVRPAGIRTAPDRPAPPPDLLALASAPMMDAPETGPSSATIADPPVPAPSLPAPPPPEIDRAVDGAPAQPALYVVVGLSRRGDRRRSGWHRLPDRAFASRHLAESHGARLLASGRADGVVLVRQAQATEAEEPDILARYGELPDDLAEG